MQSTWYVAGKMLLIKGKVDLSKDKLKAVLVGPGYEPNAELHETIDDLTDEVDADNYKQGGMVLENVRLEPVGSEVHLLADPVSIPKTSLTACGVVIVHDATSTLLVCLAGSQQSAYKAEFVIEFGENGILYI